MIYTDLLFVFAFLPITIIVSLFDRSAEYKNLILVISSVIFFTWGRPAIILLLFVTVIFDYLFGLGAGTDKKLLKIPCLLASILMNGGFFIVFGRNYLFDKGGIFERFETLSFADKLIPLGIAFYTLRGVSYVFDVFKKNTEVEKNPFCLLTYMVSYHFMFAGPVVRYGDIREELRKRYVGASEINDGLTRFIMGLGKAVVLAPVFEKLMIAGLDFENTTQLGCVLGMLGFLGYYFWSFSGFTDMALGLGKMNGFHYKENLLPMRVTKGLSYTAYAYNGSVTRLFSDVLVYNGENKLLYLVTATLCGGFVGAWYGFYKGAVVGGIAMGLCVAVEKLLFEKKERKIPKIITAIYTAVITLGVACTFCFDSLWKAKNWAFACVGKMTGGNSGEAVKQILQENYVLVIFGVLFALPIVCDGVKKLGGFVSKHGGYGLVRILQTIFTVAVLCMYTVESYFLV